MLNTLKKWTVLLVGLIFIGIIFEVFSVLLYYGFMAEAAWECRSACYVWPGIRIFETCPAICLDSNSYHRLFFILGLISIFSPLFTLIYLRFKYR
jgi:hypothetical protein